MVDKKYTELSKLSNASLTKDGMNSGDSEVWAVCANYLHPSCYNSDKSYIIAVMEITAGEV
jgi:hypothetical protein